MNVFLNILLFVVCLSTLIMVHELGHFTAAKAFKIYCDDFSLGFGKAFLHKKKKNGETYFSLRIIPFGGFVALAEKEGPMPSGFIVPRERSLDGIRKWKKAVIMSAGVIMNFVLAFFLIYFSNQFFEAQWLYSNAVDVVSGSVAEKAGVVGSQITEDGKYAGGHLLEYSYDPNYTKSGELRLLYDTRAFATFENGETQKITAVLYDKDISYKADMDYSVLLHYYVQLDGSKLPNYSLEVTATSTYHDSPLKEITMSPYFYVREGDINFCPNCHENYLDDELLVDKDGHYHCPTCDPKMEKEGGSDLYFDSRLEDHPFNIKPTAENKFERSGVSIYYHHEYLGFGRAIKKTCAQYGEGATLIFRTLGQLFTGKGWENTGSIIAIYTQAANVLNSRGFGYYLYYWGLISINLGIVNLLPFPGLDGWHLLVIGVEAITRKKIPDKFKTVMSYIGLGLLFILMAALIIKDIVGFF